MFDDLERPYYGPGYPADYLGRAYHGPAYPFGPYGYYLGDWWGPYSMYQTGGQTKAGGLGDVTIGPHLISPIGWPYAWGQALGLWGQKDEPSSDSGSAGAGTDHGRPGARDHRRDHHRDHETDWSTIAWAGLGVMGVFGAIYLITRKQG